MNLFDRFLGWLDDAINPIVVKEVRQAVQGRFVSGILLLFLFLQILTVSLMLMDRVDRANFSLGREVFTVLLFFLMMTCLVALPAYAGFRFSSERSANDNDLLFITTITPGSIIRGKFIATMALVGIYYSVCLPFMTLTYFLRGVDLPTIFFIIFFTLISVAGSVLLEIFLATLPANQVLRGVLGLGGVVVLFWNLGLTSAIAADMLRTGVGHRLWTWGFWNDGLVAAAFIFSAMGFFYAMSVAFLMPPTANRGLGVRLYLSAVWLVTGSLMAIVSTVDRVTWPMVGWMAMTVFAISVLMPLMASERVSIGPRIRRRIPSNPLGRLAAFFYYSGAASGLAWCALHLVLTIAAGLLFWDLGGSAFTHHGNNYHETLEVFAGMGLFAFCYSLTSLRVFDLLPAGFIDRSYVWFLALIIAGICGSVPPVLGFMFFESSRKEWLVLNPFILSESDEFRRLGVMIGAGWALVTLVLSIRWLYGQWDRFRPFVSGDSVPVGLQPLPIPMGGGSPDPEHP